MRALIVVLSSIPLFAFAAPMSLSITVVGPDAGDPRWAAVDEAVEFWNDELAMADLQLGPATRVVRPVPDDALRASSDAVLAGRRGHGVPRLLEDVPGDIVVALSNAELISFAIRRSGGSKGFVGMRRADIPPLSLPNVLRNVVAHELGHVLGLQHNSDPTTLMCGRPAPCRPTEFTSDVRRFFPLTDADRANLRLTRR
jgi:hypothetical protein